MIVDRTGRTGERAAKLLAQEAVIDREIQRLLLCRALWRRARTYPHPWREAALDHVVRAIGEDRAARWLIEPIEALACAPIEAIETEDGAARLRQLLARCWRSDGF